MNQVGQIWVRVLRILDRSAYLIWHAYIYILSICFIDNDYHHHHHFYHHFIIISMIFCSFKHMDPLPVNVSGEPFTMAPWICSGLKATTMPWVPGRPWRPLLDLRPFWGQAWPSFSGYIWVFPKIRGTPKWMDLSWKTLIKMDDLGVPLFSEASI